MNDTNNLGGLHPHPPVLSLVFACLGDRATYTRTVYRAMKTGFDCCTTRLAIASGILHAPIPADIGLLVESVIRDSPQLTSISIRGEAATAVATLPKLSVITGLRKLDLGTMLLLADGAVAIAPSLAALTGLQELD